MVETKHAVITDEMLEDVRRRVGVEWTPPEPYFNSQATRDAIRHFSDGIGDLNPLYRDEAYAKKTRWGKLIASPGFYFSVSLVGHSVGLPGIHGWWAGSDWEFYRPLYVDEFVTRTEKLVDMVEKRSERAGRIFLQYSQVIFRTAAGGIPAKTVAWTVRAERRAAGERGKRKDEGMRQTEYTEDEMQGIVEAALAEKPRGAEPRYWEDVTVDEQLEPIVRGPLSIRDIYAWEMGAGARFIKAHGLFYRYVAHHPGVLMRDSKTGKMDVPVLVHMQESMAKEVGVAGVYDIGPQRTSWLFNLVTNWMGDDAFLWKFRNEVRRFNIVGDTTWLKGKVTRKYKEQGMNLVDLEIWSENQRGEITAPGRATVSLSSRVYGLAALPPEAGAALAQRGSAEGE